MKPKNRIMNMIIRDLFAAMSQKLQLQRPSALGRTALLVILAGCGASPAPQFFGAARHDLTLEGIRFTVFLKDDRAEVIRRGHLSFKQRDHVPPLMIRAAEIASGCTVAGPAKGLYRSPSLPGDTGEQRFVLRC